MRPMTSQIGALREYLRASRDLTSWARGAQAMALLDASLECGLLETLRSGCTIAEGARVTGLDGATVSAMCLALAAHGVVMAEGERYVLAHPYAQLAAPDAAIPLASVLRYQAVVRRRLEDSAATTAYTTMSSTDVLAMAEGSGVSALSSSIHVAPAVVGQALPEVDEALSAGARHLEVGCGVGNALLGIVSYYPAVTAVGIEIDAATAQEARRRAEVLGLEDRVEVRTADATDLADEGVFDTVQWSQFFFPTPSRVPVLRAIFRALRPGGYLFAPCPGAAVKGLRSRWRETLGTAWRAVRSRPSVAMIMLNDVLGDTPKRRRAERRLAALQRLMLCRWGVPVRSIEELTAEIEGAGFLVIRPASMPVSQFVITRGFVLARRPVS